MAVPPVPHRIAPDRTAALRRLFGQIARFGVTGVAAAGVDYGILQLAMTAGLGPQLGRVPAIAGAMLFAWWINRRFTFRTPAPPSWAELIAYCGTAAIGALVSYAIYAALLWLGATLGVAFVLGTLAGAVFNFLRYRILLGRPGSAG
jgi:putative flippase GtrA